MKFGNIYGRILHETKRCSCYHNLLVETIVDYSDPSLLLKISQPNSKIDHWSFSLRSGYTCPYAKDCLSKVKINPDTAKRSIERGKDSEVTCFSATQELMFPAVYKMRV